VCVCVCTLLCDTLCIGSSVYPSINFSPAMAPCDEAREISSAPAGAVVDENSNESTNFLHREKRLPLAELDNRIVLPKRRGALQRFFGIGPTEDLESSMPPSRWTDLVKRVINVVFARTFKPMLMRKKRNTIFFFKGELRLLFLTLLHVVSLTPKPPNLPPLQAYTPIVFVWPVVDNADCRLPWCVKELLLCERVLCARD
jgi:hypothetical protein